MTKPHSDEPGVLLCLALCLIAALIMLGYLVFRFWPAIVALFD